jgi:hypothetical protein
LREKDARNLSTGAFWWICGDWIGVLMVRLRTDGGAEGIGMTAGVILAVE